VCEGQVVSSVTSNTADPAAAEGKSVDLNSLYYFSAAMPTVGRPCGNVHLMPPGSKALGVLSGNLCDPGNIGWISMGCDEKSHQRCL
jgi:hypothetical protein